MSTYTPVYYDDSNTSYKRTAKDLVATVISPRTVLDYLLGLIPIITWIKRYNLTWLTGDLIAGITIGCVVVPQGMAYAKLATLPLEYGLYSSFTGVFVYCFFATSKDITIGPVAVMSLLMATILADINHHGYSSAQIASALALFAGLVVLAVGLLRLGYIVDFISGPVIAGFMSGSALTIGIGQVAGLFGIPNINTRGPCYLVVGDTLRGLPTSTADAGFGLVGLFLLYAIRYGSEFLAKRFPKFKRALFFINTGRSVFLVILSTLIAYGMVKNLNPKKYPIKLNGTVPAGLKHVGTPQFDSAVLGELGSNLPVVVLVLVLEHVAIAKSFGRLNDYVINPNQELIAIGVANILGSFFGAYPATGSFSRTAIKAKAGVRTPLAGVISGCIVILALYALTPAFYYIPNATLSAVIIHAVADLFSGYKTWKQYWLVSPFEFLIFFSGVVIIFFTTVEIGVYVTVPLSMFILITRLAHPRFSVLGRVSVKLGGKEKEVTRYIYVPIDHPSVRTRVELESLPPGVVAVRLEESYAYPNAAFLTDRIIEAGKAVTRRGSPPPTTKGERNWNDDGLGDLGKDTFPLLRAIVVDFACVSIIDSTAIQGLSMARASLDRYAGRPVQWHFANVIDAPIRRALLAGGFGGETPHEIQTQEMAMVPVLNQTQTTLDSSEGITLDVLPEKKTEADATLSPEDEADMRDAAVAFIHYDLDDAVRAASRAPQ